MDFGRFYHDSVAEEKIMHTHKAKYNVHDTAMFREVQFIALVYVDRK